MSPVSADKDFQRCVEFHGHTCPGLAIGYRAAKAALDWLKEERSFDEELVAIVETDSCSVDAIQVLTGCTFGKGNLFYKDYGKHVFTLAGRETGKGVRIALRAGVLGSGERHLQLREKMGKGQATDEERREFVALHDQKTRTILQKPLEELFTIKPASIHLPPKAKVEESRPCARCAEPVMVSKLQEIDGAALCQDCLHGV